MRHKKLNVWLPMLFAITVVIGMIFGAKLTKYNNSKSVFSYSKSNTVQQVFNLLQEKYVDSLIIDSLTESVITNTLANLDPHSIYIPYKEVEETNEAIIGNFGGIGVVFSIFSDTVNVLGVLDNGPGKLAGLQIGDKIIKVNDSIICNKKINQDDVKNLIKGEIGTKLTLTIKRNNEELKKELTRGVIPINSVDAGYMLDDKTGYIKVSRFSETTYQEFMKTLETLQKQGLQNLILDLRDNGGGVLSAAVDICDEFIADNNIIVYTKGEHSKRYDYKARRQGIFEKGKLIILVNELSASASEVVSGCVQDLDRATIVGRRTFGKGLVQSQFELSNGAMLRLTTARYYTPLGRCIQRPYSGDKDEYMVDIINRYTHGDMMVADSNKVNSGKEFTTANGKKLYDGGGIMPDIFVPIDTSLNNKTANEIISSNIFKTYVYNYYCQQKQKLIAYKSVNEFLKNDNFFNLFYNGFYQYLSANTKKKFPISEMAKRKINNYLQAELARYVFNDNAFYKVVNKTDPMLMRVSASLN